MINLEMKIGDSVTTFPALAGIYMNYGIDFCCGGDRSIAVALADSGANREVIISAIENKLILLEESGETTEKLSEQTNEVLIDHIINTHHKYLRQNLPLLGINLFKLIEVHGDTHPELFEVHRLVGQLRIELEAHLILEEKKLFPQIRLGDLKDVYKLIIELEEEHDAAGDVLKRLTVVTDHFKIPQDACTTYVHTYKLLQQLQEDMYQHVHKENNILFKRFRSN